MINAACTTRAGGFFLPFSLSYLLSFSINSQCRNKDESKKIRKNAFLCENSIFDFGMAIEHCLVINHHTD
jgi:hypothetical protein